MHRTLKAALANAEGQSQHVVVVMLDIRGFSKFSDNTDSANVATYISKIYLKIVAMYEEVASDMFFKTTGDGLLMIFPFKGNDLQEVYQKVVEVSLRCHDSFDTLLENEPMINFDTPERIGIGITRGAACSLVSEEDGEKIVLDYSGHKLNLAARLQDLARPSGVILEGSTDIKLLDETTGSQFGPISVFVKSVAEKEPIEVYVSNLVEIGPGNLNPMGLRWQESLFSKTKTQFNQLPGQFYITLEDGELVESSIRFEISRKSNPRKKESEGIMQFEILSQGNDYKLIREAGKNQIVFLPIHTMQKYARFFGNGAARCKYDFSIRYQIL